MTLGPNRAKCLTELTTALRPVVGDAVDDPKVQANLAALADALFAILTKDAAVSIAPADNPAWSAWWTTVGTGAPAGPPPAVPLTGKLT